MKPRFRVKWYPPDRYGKWHVICWPVEAAFGFVGAGDTWQDAVREMRAAADRYVREEQG